MNSSDPKAEESSSIQRDEGQNVATRQDLPERAQAHLRRLFEKDSHLKADFDETWRVYHATIDAMHDPDSTRAQFLDYVTKHRSLGQLLARAINFKNWKTLWAIWARFPKAHGDGVQALHFDALFKQPIFVSVDDLMARLRSIVTRIRQIESFPESNETKQKDLELSKSLLKNVVYPIIHRYMKRSDPKLTISLLRILKDPLLYEDLLMLTTQKKQTEIAHELYTLYRHLPNVKIRGHVMHSIVDNVYFPGHHEGMEMVKQDFYARFDRLDMGFYRQYMIYYSRRGDAYSVQRLWDEYTTHYAEERKRNIAQYRPNSMKDNTNPDFLALLHVYAIRGELTEARRVFTMAQKDFGPRLNPRCWNILLNAHAKAGEYEAAIRVFGALMQSAVPDSVSFGTLMGMTGSRGDLEFTLELYRMAKNQGVEPNVTMVDCVVEAYCQNDKSSDAENIVTMTTEKERFPRKQLVILWNTLLNYHARRRNLTKMNQLLNEMTNRDIKYDSETYSVLLRGLSLCRQPHHALYLIQQAVKEHSFKPNAEHYSLLMGAFFQTGEYQQMLRTSTILRDLGVPQTDSILYRVFQALGAWAQTPPGGGRDASRMYLVSALRQFRQSIEWGRHPQKAELQRRAHDDPWVDMGLSVNTVSWRTKQASLLIFTFAQMRHVAEIPEILKLWKSSSPETSTMKEPPLRLHHALMLSAFYEGNYSEVRNIWNLVFDRAQRISRVSAPGTQRTEPLPSLRYMLSNPLKTMQRMHAATEDADGLRETVASVLTAGFRLDSKNWNYYVQLLASMKKWREAFVVCEQQLMPFWRGWRSVRHKQRLVAKDLPLQMRRRGMDPHMPRPISFTLTVLSKAYMDLEKMIAWSTEAERLQSYVTKKAPLTVSAVQTQLRSRNSMERRIMEGLPDARPQKPTEARSRASKKSRRTEPKDEMDDIPVAFQEMMMEAEKAQRSSDDAASSEAGDWDVEEETGGETTTPSPLVVETIIDGAAEAAPDDGEWTDVDEYDHDNWEPITFDQEADRVEQRIRAEREAARASKRMEAKKRREELKIAKGKETEGPSGDGSGGDGDGEKPPGGASA